MRRNFGEIVHKTALRVTKDNASKLKLRCIATLREIDHRDGSAEVEAQLWIHGQLTLFPRMSFPFLLGDL